MTRFTCQWSNAFLALSCTVQVRDRVNVLPSVFLHLSRWVCWVLTLTSLYSMICFHNIGDLDFMFFSIRFILRSFTTRFLITDRRIICWHNIFRHISRHGRLWFCSILIFLLLILFFSSISFFAHIGRMLSLSIQILHLTVGESFSSVAHFMTVTTCQLLIVMDDPVPFFCNP